MAKTKLFAVIIIVYASLAGLTGLEFTLDVSWSTKNALCGVLKCAEGHLSNKTNSVNSISTMTIVKSVRPRSSAQGSVIASLTQREPNIDRVSDGIKVKGALNAERALIWLEMKKREDCFAYYTCEIVLLNSQGQEIVQSSSVRQTTPNIESRADSGLLTSSIALQQFALLQQLDSKLALLESSLDSKLGTLEMRLSNTRDRLEDTIENIQQKVQSVKDLVADKIENKVVEKLCQLDTKLSIMEAKVDSGASKTSECDSSLAKKLENGQQKVIWGILTANEEIKNLLNVTEYLQKDLTTIAGFHRGKQNVFCNFISDVDEIMESNRKFYEQVSDDLLQLSGQVNNVSHISLSTKEKSDSIMSMIHQTFIDANASIGSILQDNIFNMVYPKTCTKGMISAPFNAKFPYPVIRPNAQSILDVPYLCDTDTTGGGWILIQRRISGNTNFYRDWETYKQGFGALDEDFWLGNDNIHKLTSSAKYELRIDIKFDGKAYFAHYTSFSISNEENLYALSLIGYSGTAGDALDHERGRPFTTFDNDNDAYSTNCAQKFKGAWWYGNCHNSNLNGKWKERNGEGPRWVYTSGNEPVTFTEMKIRRVE